MLTLGPPAPQVRLVFELAGLGEKMGLLDDERPSPERSSVASGDPADASAGR